MYKTGEDTVENPAICFMIPKNARLVGIGVQVETHKLYITRPRLEGTWGLGRSFCKPMHELLSLPE